MLFTRALASLWLIGRLGLGYVLALQLRRILPGLARLWFRRLHHRGSAALKRHILRHGGLLIKVGQYIASRPDVFPLPYVDALADLRDQVPPRPLATLRPQLEAAYEGRVDEHLSAIDDEALAAASFGQVHRARLVDGSLVAVKIQYPGLAALVRLDLRMVRLVVAIFKTQFPGWPLDMVADEIERTSREEQDYLYEGRNADRLRVGMADQGLRIPAVRWAHTREKVLVMEFAPGRSLGQVAMSELGPADRLAIAERVIDGFLHQLLVERFFHADPHGGNLILDLRGPGDWDLWLIDFGMTASLTARESELYGRFLARLQANDTDGMVEVLSKLGYLLPGADRDRLKALAREVYSELAHLNPRTFKGSRRQLDLAAKINGFLRRMQGLTFPRHTLMLSRATALVEGLCMDLAPDRNFLDLVRPRLDRFLGWRARVRWLREQAIDLYADLRAIPDRVQSIQQTLIRLDEAPRRDPALLAGLVLVAALLLPEGGFQPWPQALAGAALILALLRKW